jgi:hypothetical protein
MIFLKELLLINVGGFGSFHALINSFIHFVMYGYYGMAAMGPKYKKYLWWKNYMTKMQMVDKKIH